MPRHHAVVGGAAGPGLGEDTGPHPAVRALTGLLLGLGVGLVSALLLPRREDSGSTPAPAAPGTKPPTPRSRAS